MDVGAWLRKLGLGQYEQAFHDNDIEAGMLSTLTANDFTASSLSRALFTLVVMTVSSTNSPVLSRVAVAAQPPNNAPKESTPVTARRETNFWEEREIFMMWNWFLVEG